MAETIVNGKWHWYQLPEDLKQQAGYDGVSINPLSMLPASCTGITDKGNKFTITWRLGHLMMISLLKDERALIDAFAVVVEYEPFCKYTYKYPSRSTSLITYEWAKNDSKERFEVLQQDYHVDELQFLE